MYIARNSIVHHFITAEAPWSAAEWAVALRFVELLQAQPGRHGTCHHLLCKSVAVPPSPAVPPPLQPSPFALRAGRNLGSFVLPQDVPKDQSSFFVPNMRKIM